MLKYSQYVWRGDRLDNRDLLPSFDRYYKGKPHIYIEERLRQHLEKFKLAVRGRRGANPPRVESENDWWALGQHNGLRTPLLDWTRAPFVALFFAFEHDRKAQTPNRVVYAIRPESCEEATPDILKQHTGNSRPDIVEFFSPLQDENARLVSQNGLLSRCTAGKALDKWVAEHYVGVKRGILIRIRIPDQDREECLRTLDRMNINHLTLFPDMYGASHFCNMADSIAKY